MSNKKKIISKRQWIKISLELLVVFIGVSAGFLLNNMRIESEKEKVELNYLNFFLTESEKSIEKYEEQIESDSVWIQSISEMFDTTIISDENMEEVALNIFDKLSAVSFLDNSTKLFNGIIYSGDIRVIDNFEIRNSINGLLHQFSTIENMDKVVLHFFESHIEIMLLNDIDFINGRLMNVENFNIKKAINTLYLYSQLIQTRLEVINTLKEETEKFSALLSEELGKA